jgi:hypothetical protein
VTVLDRVPTASLAVAIALVLAAGVARVVVLADDRALRRTALLYLEPLCTWCLIAVVVHGVALGAAGTVSVAGIALMLLIAAAAVALPIGDAPQEPAEPQPQPQPETPPPPPAPATGGSLWSR